MLTGINKKALVEEEWWVYVWISGDSLADTQSGARFKLALIQNNYTRSLAPSQTAVSWAMLGHLENQSPWAILDT